MKLNFQWKESKSQFSGTIGHDLFGFAFKMSVQKLKIRFKITKHNCHLDCELELFLNRIRIGASCWNYGGSKEDPKDKNYVGSTTLSDKMWYSATESEVQSKVEVYITMWFEEALKCSEVK